jgi:hypothetical protein
MTSEHRGLWQKIKATRLGLLFHDPNAVIYISLLQVLNALSQEVNHVELATRDLTLMQPRLGAFKGSLGHTGVSRLEVLASRQ